MLLTLLFQTKQPCIHDFSHGAYHWLSLACRPANMCYNAHPLPSEQCAPPLQIAPQKIKIKCNCHPSSSLPSLIRHAKPPYLSLPHLHPSSHTLIIGEVLLVVLVMLTLPPPCMHSLDTHQSFSPTYNHRPTPTQFVETTTISLH